MSLLIRNKATLENYFAYMIIFTLILVGVVIASFIIPAEKESTATLMVLLSSISIGLNMKVVSMINKKREEENQ